MINLLQEVLPKLRQTDEQFLASYDEVVKENMRRRIENGLLPREYKKFTVGYSDKREMVESYNGLVDENSALRCRYNDLHRGSICGASPSLADGCY